MFMSRVLRVACSAAIAAALLPASLDMKSLHPYEYVYFNRAFGGLQAACSPNVPEFSL